MGSLIGFLATTFIGEKWARPAAYALLALGVAIVLTVAVVAGASNELARSHQSDRGQIH